MNKIILAISILGTLSFTQAEAALLKILSSEPDTKVFDVTDPMNKKELGRAPLSLEDFDTSEPKLLMLEKPGFSSAYIPFSQGVATHFSVMATLHPISNWTTEELTRKTVDTAEAMVDRITSVQVLLDARKVKEAMHIIDSLKIEYPNSFSVRLLQANAFLLNGDGKRAQTIYSSLLDEVPSSRSYMKQALELMQSGLAGKRMPASVKGDR
jgi:hypothetical protein